ncbi:MAG: LysE family transporter [Myxococcales bacterium]|nr:LysE family transporter [Myxococcales bacterium]
MPFLEGYATGLALIVLIGPVLFVLLQATWSRGRAHGLAVAFGIFVSDILAVLLCAYGAGPHLDSPAVRPWLVWGGAALLLGFGLGALKGPALAPPRPPRLELAGLAGDFARGFFVNFVNPFVFMVWLGLIGAATQRHGFDRDLAAYLAGCLLGILTLDVAKALLAERLKVLLRPLVLRRVMQVAGVALIAFALRLAWLGVAGRA